MPHIARDALYLLGTGTPTPTPERFGTAFAVRLGEDWLLFDCGPAATWKMARAGIRLTQISRLFLTHHHFDHNVDLPCFLLTRWDQCTGGEPALEIYGPPPTMTLVRKLIGPDGAFAGDWIARVRAPVSQRVHVNRGGTLPRPEPVFDVFDIDSGEVCRGDGWRVTAQRVRHVEPWLLSLAYRVDTERGSLVIGGDALADGAFETFAHGADTFVADCWNHQAAMDADGEAAALMGTQACARFAAAIGARRLVVAHAGPNICRPGSRERAIGDMAALFRGDIIFGEEGMVLSPWIGTDASNG